MLSSPKQSPRAPKADRASPGAAHGGKKQGTGEGGDDAAAVAACPPAEQGEVKAGRNGGSTEVAGVGGSGGGGGHSARTKSMAGRAASAAGKPDGEKTARQGPLKAFKGSGGGGSGGEKARRPGRVQERDVSRAVAAAGARTPRDSAAAAAAAAAAVEDAVGLVAQVGAASMAALTQLAASAQPHPTLARVLEPVCILLGEEPGWDSAKGLLRARGDGRSGPKLVERIAAFDQGSVSAEAVARAARVADTAEASLAQFQAVLERSGTLSSAPTPETLYHARDLGIRRMVPCHPPPLGFSDILSSADMEARWLQPPARKRGGRGRGRERPPARRMTAGSVLPWPCAAGRKVSSPPPTPLSLWGTLSSSSPVPKPPLPTPSFPVLVPDPHASARFVTGARARAAANCRSHLCKFPAVLNAQRAALPAHSAAPGGKPAPPSAKPAATNPAGEHGCVHRQLACYGCPCRA